jgi:hypothetical protein
VKLTQEQLDKLTVVVKDGSKVLCSNCLGRRGVALKSGQVQQDQMEEYLACLVVPDQEWRCPECAAKIFEGRGWGKCPSCSRRRGARRTGWVYIVNCPCVETPEQRAATMARYKDRESYYKREHDREVAPQQEAAEARALADSCLSEMPDQTCEIPVDSLPHPFCHACKRFRAKPQVRTGTPLGRVGKDEWSSKSGWKDAVPMVDDCYEIIQGF